MYSSCFGITVYFFIFCTLKIILITYKCCSHLCLIVSMYCLWPCLQLATGWLRGIECANNAPVKLKCKQEEPSSNNANQLYSDDVGGQCCVTNVYLGELKCTVIS